MKCTPHCVWHSYRWTPTSWEELFMCILETLWGRISGFSPQERMPKCTLATREAYLMTQLTLSPVIPRAWLSCPFSAIWDQDICMTLPIGPYELGKRSVGVRDAGHIQHGAPAQQFSQSPQLTCRQSHFSDVIFKRSTPQMPCVFCIFCSSSGPDATGLCSVSGTCRWCCNTSEN